MADNASSLPFELKDNLIYHINKYTKARRLCVSSDQGILKIIFKMTHDDIGHPGFKQTHYRITQALFIHNLSKKIIEYLKFCPDCSKNRTLRHKPYGYLQPIESPSEVHDTIGIDFILALPTAKDGKNCILSVTDKFSKCFTFIPGITTWQAFDWAKVLLDRLAIINWGLPRAIVSDQDPKFVSQVWKAVFKHQNVKLLFSTSYHPQTDGASERKNATAEIALRYFITGIQYVADWQSVLPRLQLALNNSPKFSTSNIAPTQLLHGKRANEPLDLVKLPVENVPSRNVLALTTGVRKSTRLSKPSQNVVDSTTPRSSLVNDKRHNSSTSTRTLQKLNTNENRVVTNKGDLVYDPNQVDASDAISIA